MNKKEWQKTIRKFYGKLPDVEKIAKNIIKTLEKLKIKEGKNVLEILLEEREISCCKLAEKLNLSPEELDKEMIKTLNRYALIHTWYTENSFDIKYLHYGISKLGEKIMQEDYKK